MAKSKRTTRRTTVQNQQQLQVELPNNSVLALAAPPLPPPLPPSLPILSPSPKTVTSGSSPNKFLILAEEGSSPQPVASSPSTPDRVLVEECLDEEDYKDEVVDYSISGRPTVTPSSGNNLDAAFNSASRVLPLNGSGHSVIPVSTSTKRSSPPVTALPQTSPGLVEVDHSSPTTVPHSGTSPAPIEKWRDLFASNRNTTTGPKFPHFSASCNDLPCDLSSDDLDNNYNVWQSCLVGYVAGKSSRFKALSNIISSSWKCEASLTIHESGWLVYRFKNIDDKLAVLVN